MAIVHVTNFAELKTAIEDETSTEIIADSDITFSGGAKVNVKKSELIIDFNNFTITDNNNLNFTDTIYIPSTSNTLKVTVKNAVWSGRNYYGVVGVYNGDTNATIELININYTGPQFVYNKNGITNIKDCTIKIDKNNSTTNAQEFCEANRLNILGNVTVVSTAQSDATIWFTGTGASLTVEENANFNVNASATYFLYTDVAPNITCKSNSYTYITTKSGLFYAAGSASHIASSFTLEENASFIAYKQNSNIIPMFKCQSNFTLEENSTFMLYSEIISSTALMYFGQVANIQISSPKRVVLYNRGGSIFSFQTGTSSNPNTISINTEMLRMWNIATSPLSSAGGLTDIPTTQYYKLNYDENINIVAKSTSSQLTSVDNNLTSDDIGYPITTSTFKLLTSNVISMGHIDLSINEITDQSTNITGNTEADANMELKFDSENNTFSANDDGNYDFQLTKKLDVDTIITISTNKTFLTKTQTTLVSGSIAITNISPINFYNFTSKGNQNIVFRQNPNWSLEVTDTRTSGSAWYLYAYILNPLSFENDMLENALIFKENNKSIVLSQTPILIFSGNWKSDSKITNITWKNVEGFLLQIDTNTIYNKGDYQTSIYWQITTTLI